MMEDLRKSLLFAFIAFIISTIINYDSVMSINATFTTLFMVNIILLLVDWLLCYILIKVSKSIFKRN